jgi:class 3 adenylate cyclase
MNGGERGLPSGSVTFVLTDMEGSTRLLRRWGDHYAELLDRQRSILRQVWTAHDGHEVDSEGDESLVAFGNADNAVSACAEAQSLLGSESWPEDGRVRVRMGVHCGPAAPRGDRYVAMAVHQTARVAAAAHGGQVLVSSQAAEALNPVAAAALSSLGRYRLRDFDSPALLFQLTGSDLPARFPALRALPADLRHPSTGPAVAARWVNALLAELDNLIVVFSMLTARDEEFAQQFGSSFGRCQEVVLSIRALVALTPTDAGTAEAGRPARVVRPAGRQRAARRHARPRRSPRLASATAGERQAARTRAPDRP